jgi:hypothetical protein
VFHEYRIVLSKDNTLVKYQCNIYVELQVLNCALLQIITFSATSDRIIAFPFNLLAYLDSNDPRAGAASANIVVRKRLGFPTLV